jgi:uncharacterized protein with von Willebrand factor type A (vWA) domain
MSIQKAIEEIRELAEFDREQEQKRRAVEVIGRGLYISLLHAEDDAERERLIAEAPECGEYDEG